MGNTGDGLTLSGTSSVPNLTPEQRANLAIVQARLGVDEFHNPNIVTRPSARWSNPSGVSGGQPDNKQQ